MADKVSVPFFRTPYNYDTAKVSDETGLKCLDLTLAQQQFKEDCDINTIVERFGFTGELPKGVRLPMYGDFTGIGDFRDALAAISAADEALS